MKIFLCRCPGGSVPAAEPISTTCLRPISLPHMQTSLFMILTFSPRSRPSGQSTPFASTGIDDKNQKKILGLLDYFSLPQEHRLPAILQGAKRALEKKLLGILRVEMKKGRFIVGSLLLLVLSLLLVPPGGDLQPAWPCGSRSSACESNLKNLATALEIWSIDHQGHYPEELWQLVPNYLRRVPRCPPETVPFFPWEILDRFFTCTPRQIAVGPSGDYTYFIAKRDRNELPIAFVVICKGQRHKDAGFPRDYPRYTSEKGLLRSP